MKYFVVDGVYVEASRLVGDPKNPSLRGFLLWNSTGKGFPIAIAFAEDLSDALDLAANASLLDCMKTEEEEYDTDYPRLGDDWTFDIERLVASEFNVADMEEYQE